MANTLGLQIQQIASFLVDNIRQAFGISAGYKPVTFLIFK